MCDSRPDFGGIIEHANMNGSFDKIKCGQIFIISKYNISLVCEFCGNDYCSLEGLIVHINDHFPEPIMNIKQEESISCGSEIEYDLLEIEDVKEDWAHLLLGDAGSESTFLVPESDLSSLNRNRYRDGTERSMAGEDKPKLISKLQTTRDNCEEGNAMEHKLKHITKHRSYGYTKQTRKVNAVCLKKELQANASDTNYLTRPNKIPHVNSDFPKSKARNVFECSFCYKLFDKKRNHADHENTHTGKRPHQCPLCPSTFGSSSALLWHKKALHNRKMEHKCSECGKQFVRKSYLDIHTREKHLPDTDSRRYFQCKLCDNKFDTSFKLSYHKLRVHTKNPPTFTCDYCQRRFYNRQTIVSHMHIHSGIKNFKCQYCKKDFGLKNIKTQHEQKCLLRKA